MTDPELFYECYYEALRDDVKALGGAKTVGKWFWPEKEMEAARTKLNDAMNADRRERLSDEQERLIMRRAREARGFSAALYFICDDTGFERPRSRDPEDEKEKLQRQFIDAVNALQRLTPKIEAARLKVAV